MRYLKWILTAGVSLIFLAVLADGIQFTHAQANNPVWAVAANAVPSSTNLTSVFMLDRNNAWVAGSDGQSGKAYKMRFSDGHWSQIENETATFRSPVNAIVAVSDANVWLVGDEGLLAHKDASSWHEVANPAPSANLTTIQMFGQGNEGWAAGGGVVLHYKGGTWQEDKTITASQISSLHFKAKGIGWAVGPYHIWRYNPGSSTWDTELTGCRPGYHPNCQGMINGVRALSSDEAWAVGSYDVLAGGYDFGPTPLLLHRITEGWQEYTIAILDDPMSEHRGWSVLSSVSFSTDGIGLAVGSQRVGGTFPVVWYPFVLSYGSDQKWHYEQVPYVQGALTSVSQAESSHALAVGTGGLILSYGYGGPPPQPWPTVTPVPSPTQTPEGAPAPMARVSDPHQPNVLYFQATGHTLRGGFRDYWQQHDSLQQYGYPITEEFTENSSTDGKPYTVQYLERARFEWHPENQPPYDVLLGLLGRTVTQGRENEQPFRLAPPQTASGYIYFAPTGHNLAPEFARYWQQHGGLPVYGYPISEAFTEISATDGKLYLVQYFERNRLEYHPELAEPFRVSLGLLGVQILRARGWVE